MSRHYRKPPSSNTSAVSSSTNQTLIRYRPSDNEFDEECKPSPSNNERDSRTDKIYSSPHDIHDLFEDPTHRVEDSAKGVGVTVDNDPYDFEPVTQHLTAAVFRDLADNTEITRYPPSRERKESRYSPSKETSSTSITIAQPKSVSSSSTAVRIPPPITSKIVATPKQPKPPPPTVTYSDSDDSDTSESESPSSPESSSGNTRRPNADHTNDSDSLIVPLPNETKSQKKERKRAEKKEVEDLVKKNKKKIMRLVSCCLVPIGAISLLRRAIEALM